MKKSMVKRLLCTVMTIAMILQCMSVIVSAADTAYPTYNKFDDLQASAGVQGYNGWYYMYKDADGYHQMTWNGSRFQNGSSCYVTDYYIVPGYNCPAVVVWEAPYSGVVALSTKWSNINRGGDGTNGGDIDLKIRVNDDTMWTETLKPENINTAGKTKSYKIEGVYVNKGDKIYHEVDCGTNNSNSAVHWMPIVTYTTLMEYDRDDKFFLFNDLNQDNPNRSKQGNNGWTFKHIDRQNFSNDGDTWRDMVWYEGNGDSDDKTAKGRFLRTIQNERNEVYLKNNNIAYSRLAAGWSGPTAVVWTAPYSGEIQLSHEYNKIYWQMGDAGFNVDIHLNTVDSEPLWEGTVTNANKNDSTALNYSAEKIRVKVNAGDTIWHVVEYKSAETGYGRIFWAPRISYVSYTYANDNTARAFSSTVDGKMMVAQYEGTTLKNVEVIDLPKSTTINEALGIDTTYATKQECQEYTINWEDGTTHYKVFAWDNDGSFKPLCEASDYVK